MPGPPGPPDWTAVLPEPFASPVIDDPRWVGSTRQTFPALVVGSAPTASTRLIHDGAKLFVQIQVLQDPTPGSVSGSDYRDSVYIGFSNPEYTDVQIIKIGVDGSEATSIYRWKRTGATWNGAPGVHSWLTNSTAWSTMFASGLNVGWTVNIEIDTSATAGNKFWYALGLKADLADPPLTLAWPATGAFVELDPPNTGLPAATWGAEFDKIGDPNDDMSHVDSVWGELQTYSGATVPGACSGLVIGVDDIRATNSPDDQVAKTAVNTFKAQLSTVGGAPLPAQGTIGARFRIAPCGDPVPSEQLWSDISGGGYGDGLVNDASGLIEFTCVGESPCPSFEQDVSSEQCLLVELNYSSVGPVTTNMLKGSALRVLDVDDGSDAELPDQSTGGSPSTNDNTAGAPATTPTIPTSPTDPTTLTRARPERAAPHRPRTRATRMPRKPARTVGLPAPPLTRISAKMPPAAAATPDPRSRPEARGGWCSRSE